ncbi:hypothetical protein SKAU_G00034740 [Synaphobranchus kaupii]|uniref:Uncharacterized protein n=1 Tax=Synaphobranchus kaupii TaxID=118154 RepID=A0A9Q1GEB7_SYNKA|nr:hypothetical protein SKAU_G00034740 [Synaphobranchus kaupii]
MPQPRSNRDRAAKSQAACDSLLITPCVAWNTSTEFSAGQAKERRRLADGRLGLPDPTGIHEESSRARAVDPRVRPDCCSKAVAERGVLGPDSQGPWPLAPGQVSSYSPGNRAWGIWGWLLAGISGLGVGYSCWKTLRATWNAVIYARPLVFTSPPPRSETTKYESKPRVSPCCLGAPGGATGQTVSLPHPLRDTPFFNTEQEIYLQILPEW